MRTTDARLCHVVTHISRLGVPRQQQLMTGFSHLAVAEEGHNDDDTQWRGESKILGPKWAHLPTLTIGMLGVQVLWSVEMSYGMSLVT